ncbi:MAG: 30S ribosomal protein S6 [Candidatus Omnitrophica bacterium]|nr:30S ribosomal protein S6 [Candidatus Omnitrophota bacterium]
MSKYELIYILDARASDAEKAEISKQVTDTVAKIGGKVINNQVWIDKQRFSFPMNKVWEGTYYLMNIEINGPDLNRIRRELQINERLLRFLLVKATPVKAEA